MNLHLPLLFFFLLISSGVTRNLPDPALPGIQVRQDLQPAVLAYYKGWKKKYLKPSVKVPGDFKIAFERSGTTVSEAMGYGMLASVMMADADTDAKAVFDGLNRFRKRYPSSINPAFMCWKIPASEKVTRNDSATDGDMDMALALLLAHRRWGDESYLTQAKSIIRALAATLVRDDHSLRLGDWDTEEGSPKIVRLSDLMPVHFRAFHEATGDDLWLKVEDKGYEILGELQAAHAPSTGLVPDFAVMSDGVWKPAKAGTLEGPRDGDYSYNACRVPWRIGWAALSSSDGRAQAVLKPFMSWAQREIGDPIDFKAGYHLDGKRLRGADFDSPCFITPTGVAALALGQGKWSDAVLAYGLKAHEGYYEDSVNLLSLLVMTGRSALP